MLPLEILFPKKVKRLFRKPIEKGVDWEAATKHFIESYERSEDKVNKYVQPHMKSRLVRVGASQFTDALSLQEIGHGHNNRNAYGTIVAEEYHDEFPDEVIQVIPVICGHGGSMWFCMECAKACKCINDKEPN